MSGTASIARRLAALATTFSLLSSACTRVPPPRAPWLESTTVVTLLHLSQRQGEQLRDAVEKGHIAFVRVEGERVVPVTGCVAEGVYAVERAASARDAPSERTLFAAEGSTPPPAVLGVDTRRELASSRTLTLETRRLVRWTLATLPEGPSLSDRACEEATHVIARLDLGTYSLSREPRSSNEEVGRLASSETAAVCRSDGNHAACDVPLAAKLLPLPQTTARVRFDAAGDPSWTLRTKTTTRAAQSDGVRLCGLPCTQRLVDASALVLRRETPEPRELKVPLDVGDGETVAVGYRSDPAWPLVPATLSVFGLLGTALVAGLAVAGARHDEPGAYFVPLLAIPTGGLAVAGLSGLFAGPDKVPYARVVGSAKPFVLAVTKTRGNPVKDFGREFR